MLNSVGVQAPTELKRSARMRKYSVRNLPAKADPNSACKTRKRVLTIIEGDFRNNQYSNEEYLDNWPMLYILGNGKQKYDLQHVKEELADVMVYCQNLADKLGPDPDEIVNMKMAQNEAKYPVEKADKYDKL